MRREMKAEEDEVKDKMFTKYRMSQLKRALMKNRDSMVMSQFFVNTKRRNRYACVMAVNGWKDYCKWNIHQYMMAIYDTDKGKYGVAGSCTLSCGMEVSTLSRFQPHFFKRYAERLGLNLTGEALIMHYLARNNMQCLNVNPLGRNEQEVFAASQEGLALGYIEGWNIKFNTFIPFDGLGKTKYEVSQKELEYLRDMMTSKFGSFLKTEAQAPFYTEHDMMIDIIERDMTDVGMRPSERHTRTFSSSEYLNALFEFAMRKSVSETKEKRTEY